jgi:hypothetical protein
MCLMKVWVSPFWKEEISQPSSTSVEPKEADSGSPIQMAWQQTMIRVSILEGADMLDELVVQAVDVGEKKWKEVVVDAKWCSHWRIVWWIRKLALGKVFL